MKKQVKRKWSDIHDFNIRVDVFMVDVVFVCNANKQQIKKLLEKALGCNYEKLDMKYLKGWDNSIHRGLMIPFMGGFIVLLKNVDGNFRSFVGIMIHEITHVVQYLLRDIRVPLNEGTEEVYAYLTEYITNQALLKLYE